MNQSAAAILPPAIRIAGRSAAGVPPQEPRPRGTRRLATAASHASPGAPATRISAPPASRAGTAGGREPTSGTAPAGRPPSASPWACARSAVRRPPSSMAKSNSDRDRAGSPADTLGLALLHGAADTGHGTQGDQGRAPRLAHLGLGHTHPAERRVDVQRVAVVAVGHPPRVVVQQVAGDGLVVVVGGVGKGAAAVDSPKAHTPPHASSLHRVVCATPSLSFLN